MQGPTRRDSFNLEAKRREKPYDSVGQDEARSILVVGADAFYRLFNDTRDESLEPQQFCASLVRREQQKS
jgi:hypothetical protein